MPILLYNYSWMFFKDSKNVAYKCNYCIFQDPLAWFGEQVKFSGKRATRYLLYYIKNKSSKMYLCNISINNNNNNNHMDMHAYFFLLNNMSQELLGLHFGGVIFVCVFPMLTLWRNYMQLGATPEIINTRSPSA